MYTEEVFHMSDATAKSKNIGANASTNTVESKGGWKSKIPWGKKGGGGGGGGSGGSGGCPSKLKQKMQCKKSQLKSWKLRTAALLIFLIVSVGMFFGGKEMGDSYDCDKKDEEEKLRCIGTQYAFYIAIPVSICLVACICSCTVLVM